MRQDDADPVAVAGHLIGVAHQRQDASPDQDHSQGADSVVITDFTQGADILSFGLPAGIAAPSAIHTLTVQAGDTLASLLTQAIHQTTTYTQPALSQFVLDGDTYLVMDTTADPTWAASDLAIKLTGAHTLSMTDISFG